MLCKIALILKKEEKPMVKSMKRALATVLAVALVMAPSMGVFATTVNNTASTTEAVVETVATPSVVGGIKSTVAGAYNVKSLGGVAVVTPVAAIKAAAGMTASETPYIAAYDVTAKKNPASSALLNTIAATQNASVISMVELDLSKKSAGKIVALNNGINIEMRLQLPKSAVVPGARYAVAYVAPGGAFAILPAVVTETGALAFYAKGGQGAYAVIRY